MSDKFTGLTDQGPITKEAVQTECPNHPEGRWRPGYGYAGGGFGPYKICAMLKVGAEGFETCDTIFGKKDEGVLK